MTFTEKELSPGIKVRLYDPAFDCGIVDCLHERKHPDEQTARDCAVFNKTYQLTIVNGAIKSVRRDGRETKVEKGRRMLSKRKAVLEEKLDA